MISIGSVYGDDDFSKPIDLDDTFDLIEDPQQIIEQVTDQYTQDSDQVEKNNQDQQNSTDSTDHIPTSVSEVMEEDSSSELREESSSLKAPHRIESIQDIDSQSSLSEHRLQTDQIDNIEDLKGDLPNALIDPIDIDTRELIHKEDALKSSDRYSNSFENSSDSNSTFFDRPPQSRFSLQSPYLNTKFDSINQANNYRATLVLSDQSFNTVDFIIRFVQGQTPVKNLQLIIPGVSGKLFTDNNGEVFLQGIFVDQDLIVIVDDQSNKYLPLSYFLSSEMIAHALSSEFRYAQELPSYQFDLILKDHDYFSDSDDNNLDKDQSTTQVCFELKSNDQFIELDGYRITVTVPDHVKNPPSVLYLSQKGLIDSELNATSTAKKGCIFGLSLVDPVFTLNLFDQYDNYLFSQRLISSGDRIQHYNIYVFPQFIANLQWIWGSNASKVIEKKDWFRAVHYLYGKEQFENIQPRSLVEFNKPSSVHSNNYLVQKLKQSLPSSQSHLINFQLFNPVSSGQVNQLDHYPATYSFSEISIASNAPIISKLMSDVHQQMIYYLTVNNLTKNTPIAVYPKGFVDDLVKLSQIDYYDKSRASLYALYGVSDDPLRSNYIHQLYDLSLNLIKADFSIFQHPFSKALFVNLKPNHYYLWVVKDPSGVWLGSKIISTVNNSVSSINAGKWWKLVYQDN